LGEDADALHSYPPWGPGAGGAVALRSDPGPDHLPVPVRGRRTERGEDEGSAFGQEDVRQVQGDPPSWQGDGDLLVQPAPPAAAGIGDSYGTNRRCRPAPR